MKTCPVCKANKDDSEYYRNRAQSDGLQFQCKACQKKLQPGYAAKWRSNRHEIVQAQRRRYRESHRLELAAKQRAYYRKHPECVKERAVQWFKEHPERTKEIRKKINSSRLSYKSEWAKVHPEIGRAKRQRRRARIKSALIVPFSREQLQQRLSMFGNRCWVCGAENPKHIDHVKPIAKGGAHILANLRPICRTCNCRKRDIWPFEKKAA